jgi:hypothetical protein
MLGAVSSARTTYVGDSGRASKGSLMSAAATVTHFACGSRGASEWTISGTTVDGEPVEVRGCDPWTFGADDRMVRKDSFWRSASPDPIALTAGARCRSARARSVPTAVDPAGETPPPRRTRSAPTQSYRQMGGASCRR